MLLGLLQRNRVTVMHEKSHRITDKLILSLVHTSPAAAACLNTFAKNILQIEKCIELVCKGIAACGCRM